MVAIGERYKDYEGDVCKVIGVTDNAVCVVWEQREGMVGEARYIHKDVFEDTEVFNRIVGEKL